MRFGNSTAAAVCVLAAGLALGGCEAGSSSGSSGGPALTPAANASVGANDDTQAGLAWGPFVQLQDGARHPGTYISPIMPGS